MFTGIIETTGIVKKIIRNGSNKTFWIESSLHNEIRIDQSISHNGVCLTVEETKNGMHRVTAIQETSLKTNLDEWQQDTVVNLERCMQLNSRLDGHIVQGHVDCTAECMSVKINEGSHEYQFTFPETFSSLVIEKGSIAINGISLTIFNVTITTFSVAIIPYTFEHTNMKFLQQGHTVNIEFDIIGKYVQRMIQLR